MNKPLTGVCDNCNCITNIQFKINHYPKGIQETYFDCERCGKHYTCFVTDDKVRMLQKKKERLKGDSYVTKRIWMQDEINKRMEKLKSELVIT